MTQETGSNLSADEIVRDPFQSDVESVVNAESADPFQILGPHWTDRHGVPAITVRAFHPGALEVVVLANGTEYPGVRIHPQGLFEVIVSPDALHPRQDRSIPPNSYRLRFKFGDGNTWETYDPYAFPPLLTDYDLYLSGEGTHYLNYEKLGAHVREVEGVRGVALWRLGAQRTARQRRGRFQSMGWARSPDAQPGSLAASGSFSCPAWTKAPFTNSKFFRAKAIISG